MEPGLAKKLVDLNHKLDNFFTSKAITVKVRPKQVDSDDEIELDEHGYQEVPAIGVSIFLHVCLKHICNVKHIIVMFQL